MNSNDREKLWLDRLDEVSAFYAKHGRNPSSTIAEEATLASWFTMQRVRLRNGNIRQDRADLLDAKLPHWRETSSRGDRFTQGVDKYLAFVEKNGRKPVSSSEDEDEKKIAIWMSNQKAQARRAERNGDPAPAIAAVLDAKIPGWNAQQRKPQNRAKSYPSWDESLAKLVGFIKQHEVKPVFECNDDDERRLAAWLNNQRRIFRKGNMDEKRIAKLDKAIPDWDGLSRNDGKWEKNLALAVKFYKTTGNAPSIRGESDDERKLGRWFADQKRKVASGELGERETEFTSAFPNWSEVKAPTNISSWDETLNDVVAYFEANGFLPATTSGEAHVRRMGFWMTRNRKYLKDGRLSKERTKLLDTKLPNWRKTGRTQGRPVESN